MLIDGNRLEEGSCLEADYCVVGAGAAGIVLAVELARQGLDVILIEAGPASTRGTTPDRLRGTVAPGSRHPPVNMYRRAGLGGTTSVWGGRCVPYDPIDFERREHVPESGWPIDYTEVARFYAAANALCDAESADFSAESVFGPGPPHLIPGLRSNDLDTDSLERFSLPTNFGIKFSRELRRLSSLRVVCNAVCTRVCLDSSGSTVDSVLLSNGSHVRFKAKARHFVLAMGGLETTRLLLASNDIHKDGIGNGWDQLGRYYMCHSYLFTGRLRLDAPHAHVAYGYEVDKEGVYCRRRITIRPEAQRRLGIMNTAARLYIPPAYDPAHRSSVLSMLHFGKVVLQPEYRRSFSPVTDRGFEWREPLQHAGNIVRGLGSAAQFAGMLLARRFLARRKLPSIALPSVENEYPLEINAEQVPLGSSRLFLWNETDSYGVPRLGVDWRHCSEDVESIRKFLRLLQDSVRTSGCGDFQFDEGDCEALNPVGGHHIGTARMSATERKGVVDGDCRVFGVRNLYLCSSAVFPTASHANPVLTIVAMGLRLSEHLKRQVQS